MWWTIKIAQINNGDTPQARQLANNINNPYEVDPGPVGASQVQYSDNISQSPIEKAQEQIRLNTTLIPHDLSMSLSRTGITSMGDLEPEAIKYILENPNVIINAEPGVLDRLKFQLNKKTTNNGISENGQSMAQQINGTPIMRGGEYVSGKGWPGFKELPADVSWNR